MPTTRIDAEKLIADWVTDASLRAHLDAVSTVMRAAAPAFGGPDEDPERWALAGLLHDADWQVDPDHHPDRVVAWLRANGDDDLADAVATHNTDWGVAIGPMAKALVAFDEITGFVGAVAKVKPEGLNGVTTASVVKKLKKRGFAASVDRDEVAAGAAGLGLDVEATTSFVIGALTG